MPPSVFITRSLPAPAIERLHEAGFSVDVSPHDRWLMRDELLAGVRGRDAVLCFLPDRIDAELLDAAGPTCRIVAVCAAGYENTDLSAAAARGVVVTNTPDALTEAVADLTWALLLAVARRIGEAERLVRAGRWKGWRFDEFLGLEVFGRTLGVVGFGRIGRAVARRAAGFQMTVVYHNRSAVSEQAAGGARPVSLDELLSCSDFVVLTVPLTPQTRGMIGAAQLRRMKRTAVLLNTSRGAVVDERALASALRAGVIAAAGLDVYQAEPAIDPDLLKLENVVLLPHIGSATRTTREGMALMAADSIRAVLEGRPPAHRLV